MNMKDAVKRYLSSHTEPAVSACLPRVLCLQCRMKDDIKSYLSSVGVDWEEVNDLAMVRGGREGEWRGEEKQTRGEPAGTAGLHDGTG